MTKFGKTSMKQYKLVMSSDLDSSLEILICKFWELRDAILNQNSAHKFKPVLCFITSQSVQTLPVGHKSNEL